MSARNYSFCVVCYATEEEIQPLLNAAKHYCLIKHDSDVNEDGSKRDDHFHILCTFEKNHSYNQVRNYVDSKQNTFVEAIENLKDCYDYLTHETPSAISEGKHLYDKADIVHDDYEYWSRRVEALRDLVQVQKRISADEMVNDLIADDFSVIDMGRKYGRDFMKNCKNYLHFRKLALAELWVRQKTDPETGEIICSSEELEEKEILYCNET